MLSDNKPLPDPMLTKIIDVMWFHPMLTRSYNYVNIKCDKLLHVYSGGVPA